MAREAAEAPQAVARLIAANDAACRALGERLRRDAAALRRHLRARQLRRGCDLCEISDRDRASASSSPRSVRRSARSMAAGRRCATRSSSRSRNRAAARTCSTLAEAARADGALTVALVNDTALAARRPLRSRAAAQRLAGAERRGDEILHRLARRRAAARRHWSEDAAARPRAAAPARRSRRGGRAATGRRPADAAGALSLYVVGRGPGFARGAGGRAQAQGDLRPACRGAERRGADAWPDGAGRAGFPGRSCSASATRRSPASPSSPRTLAGRGVPVIAAGPAARHGTHRAARRRRPPPLRRSRSPWCRASIRSPRRSRGAAAATRTRRRTCSRSRRRGEGEPRPHTVASRADAPSPLVGGGPFLSASVARLEKRGEGVALAMLAPDTSCLGEGDPLTLRLLGSLRSPRRSPPPPRGGGVPAASEEHCGERAVCGHDRARPHRRSRLRRRTSPRQVARWSSTAPPSPRSSPKATFPPARAHAGSKA